jgi:hypothetical protein
MRMRVAPRPTRDGRRLVLVEVPAEVFAVLGDRRAGLVALGRFESRSAAVVELLRRGLARYSVMSR